MPYEQVVWFSWKEALVAHITPTLLKEMLGLVTGLARKENVTIEKYVSVVVSFDEATATERSSLEERLNAQQAIRAIVEADPDARFDTRGIVAEVGLKQCRADRAYVGWQIRKLLSQRKEEALAA